MRKGWIVIPVLTLLLSGCGAEETFETVADELAAPVIARQRQIYVELPEYAASPAVESDSGRLYHCGEYDISVQILDSGDLGRTVTSVSGFSLEDITVLETVRDGWDCYEFVFVSAGETGDQVGHGMILDDGSYHYCLTVMGSAETAARNQAYWEAMFASFRLV